MKSIKVLLAALLLASFAFSSCSKDDDDAPAVAEGKMSATIDGKSAEFTVSAMSYKSSYNGKSYEYLIITGTKGTTQADMSSFVVTVYADDIKATTYNVPTYKDQTSYDYLKGYAMAVYMPNISSYTDYYYSYMVEKSSGSVTVKSVTDKNIQGSYNMVLVSYADQSKTMTLKGDFNAQIYNYNMTGK